jgi:hypothetical protein
MSKQSDIDAEWEALGNPIWMLFKMVFGTIGLMGVGALLLGILAAIPTIPAVMLQFMFG